MKCYNICEPLEGAGHALIQIFHLWGAIDYMFIAFFISVSKIYIIYEHTLLTINITYKLLLIE